ncbi:hypothetical protein NM208_g13513 [Fusarium decemcellulare]|uniref:Uncharacterized protein n=1 Tax=Fusarium decemcellulare TaxID=57161 RepID=A0ACC1RKS4_9HYPO|nr:hypothetical protein NM208_g13513 [Fusarium decemcellulare]
MPPIQFEQPTGLRRQVPAGHETDPRYERDKNWAPFQSPFSNDNDELSFIVEPGRVFRWTSSSEPVEDISVELESAVEAPYPPWVKSKTWHSTEKTCVHDIMMANQNVHQSTSMLMLTLCDRGKCEPHDGNTVMLGMVHRRYDTTSYPWSWYDRRMVVYAAISPYKMMSVSKKLIYHGEADGRYIWTGSMVYFKNHTGILYNRSHGFLDDEVWLSFGINDEATGWLDVEARDLIKDHYLCQGASNEYRQSIRQIPIGL